jgi:hypothetical protein
VVFFPAVPKTRLSGDLFCVGVPADEGELPPAGVKGTLDPSVPLPVLQVAPDGHVPGVGSGSAERFWASAKEAVKIIAQPKRILILVIALFS